MNTSALRTQGDGTESPDVAGSAESSAAKIHRKPSADDSKIEKLGKEYLAKQQTTSTTILFDPHQTDSGKFNFPPPVQPKGKRFYFIPKLAQQSEVSRGLKKRQLNLVLIEPYKVSSSDPTGGSVCLKCSSHCRPASTPSCPTKSTRTGSRFQAGTIWISMTSLSTSKRTKSWG